MNKEIGWELYRSFLAVLEEGSLSAAARALGVTQPTVGRHVDALEEALGLKLFLRGQAGLTPTEAAHKLEIHAQAMASTAAALVRAASDQGSSIAGIVRVTASEMVGLEILPAILAHISRRYPQLKLELVLSNRAQDLLHREADIAVRMFQPQQSQLIARRIGRIELGLFAAMDYLLERGTPNSVDELAEHGLIGFDTVTAFIRQMSAAFPKVIQREKFAISTDSDVAQLALIRAGAGIGFCQLPLAREDSRLVRVLADDVVVNLDSWITMHEDLRDNPSCRVVFDGLVEGLLEYISAGG